MNTKVFTILRILLGIFVFVFGINKFANFCIPPSNYAVTISVN